MFVTFLFIISRISYSKGHVQFYPINFCLLSEACAHDRRAICGVTGDGQLQRQFLDICDMYEYNCDFGQQYLFSVYGSCEESDKNATHEDNVKDNNDQDSKEDDDESPEKLVLVKSTEYKKYCANCYQPQLWATTKLGETRDFYKVLADDYHYLKHNKRHQNK